MHYYTEALYVLPHHCWPSEGTPSVPGRDSNPGPIDWVAGAPTSEQHFTPVRATPHPYQTNASPVEKYAVRVEGGG